MELAITVDGVCAGGGHIYLSISKNGATAKQITLEKKDFFFEPDEYETVLATIVRSRIKTLGYDKNTPLAALKTAIESEVFKL